MFSCSPLTLTLRRLDSAGRLGQTVTVMRFSLMTALLLAGVTPLAAAPQTAQRPENRVWGMAAEFGNSANVGSGKRAAGRGSYLGLRLESASDFSQDAWGKPRAGAPSYGQNQVGYTGHNWDPAVGANYMVARYQFPELGVFGAEDPVPGQPIDPLGLNPYPYVRHSPLRYTDPTGQFIPLAVWGIIALTGIIGAEAEVIRQELTEGKSLSTADYGRAGKVGVVTAVATAVTVATAGAAGAAGAGTAVTATVSGAAGGYAGAAGNAAVVEGKGLREAHEEGTVGALFGAVLGAVFHYAAEGVGGIINKLSVGDDVLRGVDDAFAQVGREQQAAVEASMQPARAPVAAPTGGGAAGAEAAAAARPTGALAGAAATQPSGQVGQQVPYGATDLSQAAQQFRLSRNVGAGRDVAIVEYQGEFGPVWMGRASAGPHAENLLRADLRASGVDPSRVTRLYSELEPCNVRNHFCAANIAREMPQAEVTFSFKYWDKAARETDQWRSAVRRLMRGQ